MVESGIAFKMPEEVWLDKDGVVVEEESEAMGRRTKYILNRPNYLVFVDEVGDNTSQKDDGNIGGTKYVVGRKNRALMRAAHHDCHFTTLGFSLADGRPLLCVIIISCGEIDAKIRMGLQPWCEVEGEGTLEDNLERNSHGKDKYFPFGPICNVNGTNIPTYIACSERGGITPDILTEALRHIDSFNAFDRTEATPALLLDGHGSRFDTTLLEYVNTPATKWCVLIGVPYGTHLWQVADSSEQNGSFKNELKRAKQYVIRKKGELHLPMQVEKTDIVGIVHRAFDVSFGNIVNSKKAIRNRGWNPLNYNLLDDKELNNREEQEAVNHAHQYCDLAGVSPMDHVESISLEGASKSLLSRIVEQEIRQKARNEALTNNAEEIRLNKVAAFQEAKRLTAGVVFNGHGCHLDQTAFDRVRELNRSRELKEQERLDNQKTKHDKQAAKVAAIRAKQTTYEKWSTNELTTMVSWYKRPGDSKIPSTRVKLVARYLLTCNRIEDERNRKKPGEESIVDDVDAAAV
jgi:hypothetical protein